jgi:hypothetical protein
VTFRRGFDEVAPEVSHKGLTMQQAVSFWRAPGTAVLTLASMLVMAGCASYGPGSLQVGASRADVERAMGRPTATYPVTPTVSSAPPMVAERLEFARGPAGQHTYMVDVDASGRVHRIEQVLTEAQFHQVVAGQTVQELLFRLGRPSHRRGGGRQPGEVWSYRYQATFCQWFQVSVDRGLVRDTAYGPDPACDVDRAD